MSDHAERDAALAVAAESFRAALVDPIYENGKPGPSIADLSRCRRLTLDGEELVNFQLQAAIAAEMTRVYRVADLARVVGDSNFRRLETSLRKGGWGTVADTVQQLRKALDD